MLKLAFLTNFHQLWIKFYRESIQLIGLTLSYRSWLSYSNAHNAKSLNRPHIVYDRYNNVGRILEWTWRDQVFLLYFKI
jgi:hypothetical protein